MAEDSDACHERVDELTDDVETLLAARPRRRNSPAVVERRRIERPEPAHLPKAKGDVDKDDPLWQMLSD